MKKPKMIVFDYGGTLCREPGFDLERGLREAWKHVSHNPRGVRFEDYLRLDAEVFEYGASARANGTELHEFQLLRTTHELLGLEFDIPLEEIEELTWTGASSGEALPNVPEMLDFLRESGIRSGVVSNIGWSGGALRRRLDRLLPRNEFEFVIASSEYGIRKPSRLLFDLALAKAGLDASEVWYCGDSLRADILGASGAGMLPVRYANAATRSAWSESNDGVAVDVEHIEITDWLELVEILKNCEEG